MIRLINIVVEHTPKHLRKQAFTALQEQRQLPKLLVDELLAWYHRGQIGTTSRVSSKSSVL